MTVTVDGTVGVTTPSVILPGSASGTVTLRAPAVAGSTIIDFPTTSGTALLQSASGALTLTNSTGGSLILQPAAGSTTATTLAFPNGVGTNGQVLTSNGAGGMTWSAGGGAGSLTIGTSTITGGTTGTILINTGNVLQQLLMGTGVSAILAAAAGGPNGLAVLDSSGQLPAAQGGTAGGSGVVNVGESGTTGSLALYNAAAGTNTVSIQSGNNASPWTLTLPIGPGTNGQFLQTNGSGVTAWATVSGSGTVNSGTANQIAFYSATGTAVSGNANVTAVSGALTLGVPGTAGGSLKLSGSTSGTVTIDTAAAAGTWTMTLPATAGTAGQVLKTDGTGITSWTTDSTSAAGANSQIQFNNAGNLGANANFVWDNTNGRLGVGLAAPSAPLHVDAASGVNPQAVISAPNFSQIYFSKGSNLATDQIARIVSVNDPTLPGGLQLTFITNVSAPILLEPNGIVALQAQPNGDVLVPTGSLLLGNDLSRTGDIVFYNATNTNTVSVTSGVSASSWTLTLPTGPGTAGQVLKTDGTGITSWAADSASAGGANTQVQYNSTGSLAGAAGFTFNGTSTIGLGVAGTSAGTINLAGSTSGTVTVTTAAAAGTWTLTLPTTAGTNGGLLQTNGSGVTSWTAAPTGGVVGVTQTQTLTNKRITSRVSSAASITSPLAVNSDNFDQYCATAQAGALTISADSGTPTDGQKLTFRLKDNGTARALTWTSGANGYRAVGITLPTTTTANKTTYVGCIWNAADTRWDAVATVTEA